MRHAHLFDGIGGEFQPELAAKCRTIRDFDDAITRVSFGWPSVDAYYAGSGSDQVSACCCMRMFAWKDHSMLHATSLCRKCSVDMCVGMHMLT